MKTVRKIIIYFFLLLFIYAAVSKMSDWEAFQMQLGESPVLPPFPRSIGIGLLVAEFAVAGMLCYERFERRGLLFSMVLMILFSIYIVVILNFSPYVPCSCGGILSELSWKNHLIFNIGCVALAWLGLKVGRPPSGVG